MWLSGIKLSLNVQSLGFIPWATKNRGQGKSVPENQRHGLSLMVAGTSHLLSRLSSLERAPEGTGHLLVLKSLEIALL